MAVLTLELLDRSVRLLLRDVTGLLGVRFEMLLDRVRGSLLLSRRERQVWCAHSPVPGVQLIEPHL